MTRILRETPDVIVFKTTKDRDQGKFAWSYLNAGRAHPFGLDQTTKVMQVGYAGATHWQMDNPNDPGTRYDRDDLIYPGRVWLDKHVISFWVYPPKNKLKNVLAALQKKLKEDESVTVNFNDSKWRLDIPRKEAKHSSDYNVKKMTGGAIRPEEFPDYGYLYSLKNVLAGKPLKGIGGDWKNAEINVNTGAEHVAPPLQKKLKAMSPKQMQALDNFYRRKGELDPDEYRMWKIVQQMKNENFIREIIRSELKKLL